MGVYKSSYREWVFIKLPSREVPKLPIFYSALLKEGVLGTPFWGVVLSVKVKFPVA